MSFWILAGLFGGIITILIICASIFQFQEHKTQVRRDFINKQIAEIQYYQRLIDSIPGIYLPKEIHLLMLHDILYNLNQCHEVHAVNIRVNQMLNHYQQEYAKLNIQTNDTSRHAPCQDVSNLAKAHTIQHRLYKMSQFIAKLYQRQKISLKKANRYNQLLETSSKLVDADCQYELGIKAHQRLDHHLAQYHYLRAIEMLSKQNTNELLTYKIQHIQAILSANEFSKLNEPKKNNDSVCANNQKKWDEFFKEDKT